MTQPESAEVHIIREPKLALAALLELRRLTTTCLSSLASMVTKGDHDAATRDEAKATIRRQEIESLTATAGKGATGSSQLASAVDDGTDQEDRSGGQR